MIEEKFEIKEVLLYTQQLEPFKIGWDKKKEFIRENSPYSHFSSYCIRSLIIKGGDDLRQELIVMQMLRKMQHIFDLHQTGLFLKTYEIIITSNDSGILEFCQDTTSLDQVKKTFTNVKGLHNIYKELFGDEFEEAQKNFVDSLAAYSIF